MAARLPWFPAPRTWALGSLMALAIVVAGLTGARPALAAPAFTVGSTVDAHWNHVAGTCASTAPGGPCTLRAAAYEALAQPAPSPSPPASPSLTSVPLPPVTGTGPGLPAGGRGGLGPFLAALGILAAAGAVAILRWGRV